MGEVRKYYSTAMVESFIMQGGMVFHYVLK